MKDDWKFDDDCLIDTCFNEALLKEVGLAELRKLVIIELRAVQRAPHIATDVHLIDGEHVYLRRIGKGWANGRVRAALMLTYTLDERVIEPLVMFKASEVSGVEEPRSATARQLVRYYRGEGSPRKASTNIALPEPVTSRLTRALRDARKRRKH
jgi:hypothetical protein